MPHCRHHHCRSKGAPKDSLRSINFRPSQLLKTADQTHIPGRSQGKDTKTELLGSTSLETSTASIVSYQRYIPTLLNRDKHLKLKEFSGNCIVEETKLGPLIRLSGCLVIDNDAKTNIYRCIYFSIPHKCRSLNNQELPSGYTPALIAPNGIEAFLANISLKPQTNYLYYSLSYYSDRHW